MEVPDRYLLTPLVHSGRKLRAKLKELSQKHKQLEPLVDKSVKCIKHCTIAAKGNEFNFKEEIKIRINHFLNVDHSKCYWDNHSASDVSISLAAKAAYQ
jgi:hypothetical protein